MLPPGTSGFPLTHELSMQSSSLRLSVSNPHTAWAWTSQFGGFRKQLLASSARGASSLALAIYAAGLIIPENGTINRSRWGVKKADIPLRDISLSMWKRKGRGW
jgi:hypothetical protein